LDGFLVWARLYRHGFLDVLDPAHRKPTRYVSIKSFSTELSRRDRDDGRSQRSAGEAAALECSCNISAALPQISVVM
jgi:hypothetical protein